MSDFDAMVADMVAMQIPREKALAAARSRFPEAAEAQDAAAVKRADTLEKHEAAVIVKMARAIQITVRSTSQARASKITPGIPDLILSCGVRKFFGFFEVKRQTGGVLSTAQREFAEDCAAAGVPCGHGDRVAFAEWLAANGFTPPVIPE